ncbi:MAG: hypothetical protein V3V88_02935, partial [Dehalococcoidia bacterium]
MQIHPVPNHATLPDLPQENDDHPQYLRTDSTRAGTGNQSFRQLTLTDPTQDYTFTAQDTPTAALWLQSQNSATGFNLTIGSKDGDTTDSVVFDLVARGTPGQLANFEILRQRWNPSTAQFEICTIGSGSPGTVHPISICTGANANQVRLNIDGSTSITELQVDEFNFNGNTTTLSNDIWNILGTANPANTGIVIDLATSFLSKIDALNGGALQLGTNSAATTLGSTSSGTTVRGSALNLQVGSATIQMLASGSDASLANLSGDLNILAVG